MGAQQVQVVVLVEWERRRVLCDMSPNGIPVGLPWLWSGLWPLLYSPPNNTDDADVLFSTNLDTLEILSQSVGAQWTHIMSCLWCSKAILANANTAWKQRNVETHSVAILANV